MNRGAAAVDNNGFFNEHFLVDTLNKSMKVSLKLKEVQLDTKSSSKHAEHRRF